jgi:hypothetical protein
VGTRGAPILGSIWNSNIPVPNNERVHFNIWAFNKNDGSDHTATPIEVRLKKITFTPNHFPADGHTADMCD